MFAEKQLVDRIVARRKIAIFGKIYRKFSRYSRHPAVRMFMRLGCLRDTRWAPFFVSGEGTPKSGVEVTFYAVHFRQ